MSDGSRGTVVAWVVAALLAGLALLRLAGSDGEAGAGAPVRLERSPAAGGAAAAGGAGQPGRAGGLGGADGPGAARIYVHVAGAVRRPGLVRLASRARVAEALERAGGPTRKAELAGVNLAATLEDGQQVVVPVRGAAGAAGLGASAAGAPAAGGGAGVGTAPGAAGVPKLSLGSATPEQLDQIDGIGPTLAERIIQHRTENGGFRSLEELREVEGIGEKRFETLREAVQP